MLFSARIALCYMVHLHVHIMPLESPIKHMCNFLFFMHRKITNKTTSTFILDRSFYPLSTKWWRVEISHFVRSYFYSSNKMSEYMFIYLIFSHDLTFNKILSMVKFVNCEEIWYLFHPNSLYITWCVNSNPIKFYPSLNLHLTPHASVNWKIF